MNRYRFKTASSDWRAVAWPPAGPYWLSGEGPEYSIVVAYAPSEDELLRFWPEALDIDLLQADAEITFSDRFPKPDWWPLETAITPFAIAYPAPWRLGDREVVDRDGCNVQDFDDTPEDREFWRGVVDAVNRGIVEVDGFNPYGSGPVPIAQREG